MNRRVLSNRRRRARFSAPAALFVLALAALSPTRAEAQGNPLLHLDVAIQENDASPPDAGRLSVHSYDFGAVDEDAIIVDRRAFVRAAQLSGNLPFAGDPGFVSRTPSTELDPAGLVAPVAGEQLHFNILSPPLSTMPSLGGRSVNFWDGVGATPTWGPTPDTDEGITVSQPAFPFSTATALGTTTTDVPGFVIGTSGSTTGSLHEHINFILEPQNGELPGNGGPDFGVFVLLIEVSYPIYGEWIPMFVGVDNFTGGGRPLQLAAADDLNDNFLLPLCSDGIDNDKDGLIDFGADGGCDSTDDMSERGALNECDNGIDDDGDGFTDFPNDGECLTVNGVSEVPEPGVMAGLTAGCLVLYGLKRRKAARRRC